MAKKGFPMPAQGNATRDLERFLSTLTDPREVLEALQEDSDLREGPGFYDAYNDLVRQRMDEHGVDAQEVYRILQRIDTCGGAEDAMLSAGFIIGFEWATRLMSGQGEARSKRGQEPGSTAAPLNTSAITSGREHAGVWPSKRPQS